MSPIDADATSGAADLVTFDPPDLAKPSGCASGGGQSVGSAWACGESWDFGKINTVCAAGFAPCTSMDGVDLSACSKLPRFYVLKLNACLDVSGCASLTPQTIRSCDGNLSGVPRWRFGCGAKLSTVQDCPLPCGGSSQAFRCLNTIGKYACESAASAELDANAIEPVRRSLLRQDLTPGYPFPPWTANDHLSVFTTVWATTSSS
jgi:hypothetical protein